MADQFIAETLVKLDVWCKGLANDHALRQYAIRRVEFQLSRFGTDVACVEDRLSDDNGAKGGVDKRCRLTLKGDRFSPLSIEEVSDNIFASVDLSVQRSARTIARILDRSRDFRPYVIARRAQ